MVALFDIEDSKHRYTIEPIMNTDLWNIYKKDAEPCTWHAQEIDFADDIVDWNDDSKISPGERHFLIMTVGFFAPADNLVADNLNLNFSNDVNIMEALFFFNHQGFIERVHSEVYSKIITIYITDPAEREKLFKSLHTIPVVAKKCAWATRYANADNASFAERLVAFAIFEGVFFSGSFAAIYYFKRKGVLPGLCFSNTYIARDEKIHCEFACALYGHLLVKLPEKTIHTMFKEAIEIESEFVKEALKIDLIGMNADLMVQYIKFVGDYWIQQLGYDKLFNVPNPFDWMNLISMQSKTNFFEKRVSDYSKSGVGVGKCDNVMDFGIDEDF